MELSDSSHFDLIVIGGGVLGTFHALHACKKHLKVALFEKDSRPSEATVRNFGQIVPSGMSKGKWQEYGRKSIEIYKSLQSATDISVRQNGTVYLASDEVELELIHELHQINATESYHSVLLSAEDCRQRYPNLVASYCKGGLLFPNEISVEPEQMIHKVIAYLREQMSFKYMPYTIIRNCQHNNGHCSIEDQFGRVYTSDKVIICGGREFSALYPELFVDAGIEVSKLQMMRTVPQKSVVIPGSILSGLSIRRYESFQECPSYHSLNAAAIPVRFKKWGIHVLFKQAIDGSIIIGDSHEYADAANQDQLGYQINNSINSIILDEAKRIFKLEDWTIASCWNGYYSQMKNHDMLNIEPEKDIHIVTAIGGKGMTAGPGLAEETIEQLFG